MHDDPTPRLVFPDTTVLINFALVDEMECYTKSGVSCVVDACDEVDDLVLWKPVLEYTGRLNIRLIVWLLSTIQEV